MDGENVALGIFVAMPVVAGLAARSYIRRQRAAAAAGVAPTRARLVVGNLLVLAFLVCLAALAGECWLRFVYDSTDSFGVLRTSDRWFARHYRINNERFRDDVEYDLGPLPAGKRRVSFVGDSFTAGHGIAEVGDRFANRVRAVRPDWQIHVFGVNGLDTGRELQLVEEQIPSYTAGRYRYDVVVLVYCMNDVADVMPEIGRVGDRLTSWRERGVLTANSYLCDWLRFLWIVRTESEIRDYYPSVSLAYADERWDLQRVRLRRFKAAITSRGGRLAVVTFPFLHCLGPAYPYRDVHRKLAEFWAAEGVPELDLLPVLEAHAGERLVVGAFDAHPNERAHAIAAEAIVPFLDGVVKR